MVCKKNRIRNSTTHLPLGYYKKSTEIRWNMIKSYAFLVLIIIIMPTFGFTYLTQVFDNLFKDDVSDAHRMWQCFFLADSGKLLFFNYVSKYLRLSFYLIDTTQLTPPRTPRISGLKSQILKPTFLN